MIKRYTKNINFDLYRNAADKLNIKFVKLTTRKNIGYYEFNDKKLFTFGHWIGVNNVASHTFASLKYWSYEILDNKDYPHPKAFLLDSKEQMKDHRSDILELKKPWVVKPLRGSEGIGVSVGIQEEDDLQNAINSARKHNKKVIVEEFIHGKHYRVLVFKGQIIDMVERIPAHVVGDGAHSIDELISEKNKDRRKIRIEEIRVDEELKRQVKEQNLSLGTVLKKDQKIFLRQNCNMCAGGETKRITEDTVHPDNIDLFLGSVDLLGLNLGGIDFITEDISKSYKEVPCAINEINKAPMPNVHYFADMKMDNHCTETILSLYFNLQA